MQARQPRTHTSEKPSEAAQHAVLGQRGPWVKALGRAGRKQGGGSSSGPQDGRGAGQPAGAALRSGAGAADGDALPSADEAVQEHGGAVLLRGPGDQVGCTPEASSLPFLLIWRDGMSFFGPIESHAGGEDHCNPRACSMPCSHEGHAVQHGCLCERLQAMSGARYFACRLPAARAGRRHGVSMPNSRDLRLLRL